MASYKMTSIMIGVILVGLFVAIISTYMAELSVNYDLEFDNSTLDPYNKLETINDKVETIKGATDIEEKSGTLDVIGGYFSDAYNILILTKDSFSYTTGMVNHGLTQVGLGGSSALFYLAIGAIVGIIIFIGIIASALMGKDL